MKAPALAAILLATSVTAAPVAPVPTTWEEFVGSAAPADKAAVSRIQKMSWDKQCIAWGRAARARQQDERFRLALVSYLARERMINGIDLGQVTSFRPTVGMTTCGVLAMLGPPEAVNHTQTSVGQSAQLVYRAKRVYVYIDGPDSDGIVRSVQF